VHQVGDQQRFMHSFCKIWGSNNRNVEDSSYLLCDAVSSNKFMRSKRIVLPVDSLTPCELFDPQYEDGIVLLSVRK
jgi:hypothetical protein